MTPRRICIITTGHLASCPRMLKAADAFVDAGHEVHVVMIRSGGWGAEADARLCARRRWHPHVVSYDRTDSPVRWVWSGVRQQAALAVVDAMPAARTRLATLAPALSRVAPEIVRVARALECDFYYAGAAGAIGLAALAANGRAPWAVDFEDAHGLEPLEFGDEQRANRMCELEALAASEAAFVTAAGDGVAAYYRERYSVRALVINNVFEPGARPTMIPGRRLSIYWCSQTVGPRRGLELLLHSLGRTRVPLTLTLQGRADATFAREFRAQAAAIAANVDLLIDPPADPDDLVRIAAGHDLGVSLEDASIPHRAICAPNKLFLYLAAGLAVAASPTPGQQPIMAAASAAFVPIHAADTTRFEAAIGKWSSDATALCRARVAAWEAAAGRWRWHHACERERLVARVAEVLG